MTTQHLSVCFVDIDRFNLAARHLTLDQLAGFLQGFYERVGDVLLAHNGRLVKYIGDGVFVTFEAGKEEVAVRAMWALRKAYAEYLQQAAADVDVTELSVGISTGDVIVGQMGHPQMLSYEVVGRPVTIAFSLAECVGLIVDRPTYEAVADRVVVESAHGPGGVHGYRITALR